MEKGERAGDTPIGIDVIEGKSYYWCSCGKSSKQPFCDGSHDGSKFGPKTYKAEQTKKFFSALVNKPTILLYATDLITKNENEICNF